jgi:hypothetical protein
MDQGVESALSSSKKGYIDFRYVDVEATMNEIS